ASKVHPSAPVAAEIETPVPKRFRPADIRADVVALHAVARSVDENAALMVEERRRPIPIAGDNVPSIRRCPADNLVGPGHVNAPAQVADDLSAVHVRTDEVSSDMVAGAADEDCRDIDGQTIENQAADGAVIRGDSQSAVPRRHSAQVKLDLEDGVVAL